MVLIPEEGRIPAEHKLEMFFDDLLTKHQYKSQHGIARDWRQAIGLIKLHCWQQPNVGRAGNLNSSKARWKSGKKILYDTPIHQKQLQLTKDKLKRLKIIL